MVRAGTRSRPGPRPVWLRFAINLAVHAAFVCAALAYLGGLHALVRPRPERAIVQPPSSA